MDEYIIDDDDLQRTNTQWVKSEWIGCNRTFRDIPEFVAIEAVRAIQIPPEIEAILPAEHNSPSQMYATSNLPTWDPALDTGTEDVGNIAIDFDAAAPSSIPNNLSEVSPLPLRTLQRLNDAFGQAWFDGKLVRIAARSFYYWNRAFEWMLEKRDDQEPEEVEWRERTTEVLSIMTGWTGHVGGKLHDLTFEALAEVLGNNPLAGAVLDALIQEIQERIVQRDRELTTVLLADTLFPTFIETGATTQSDHLGFPAIANYARLLKSQTSPRTLLAFPLHLPPLHWMACAVDIPAACVQFGDGYHMHPPTSLSKKLAQWLGSVVGMSKAQITNDLPCGSQQDVVNCGIIAVNAIAHRILGDPLWDITCARTLRLQAFCRIAKIIIRDSNRNSDTPPLVDLLSAPTSPPTNTSISQDEEMPDAAPPVRSLSDGDVEDFLCGIHEQTPAPVPSKRSRERTKEDEEGMPPPKRTKGSRLPQEKSASTSSPASPPEKLENREKKAEQGETTGTGASKKPFIPRDVQFEILESLRKGGQSNSARHDRVVAILIRYGLYRGDQKRLRKLEKECKKDDGDPNPGLDINNPKQVVCSRCKQPVQLQAVYQAGRFRDHWLKGTCLKPAAPNKSISAFFKPANAPSEMLAAKPRVKPAEFTKFCPGLTGAIHPRIDYYIENCPSAGAGARHINVYVKQLYETARGIVSITDSELSEQDRAKAYQQQRLDRTWRIETSPQHAAVVATHCLVQFTVRSQRELNDPTLVCTPCEAVYSSREFRNAINHNRDKTHAQMKCTPKIYSNPIQARLMAKYHGLEEFLGKRSDLNVFHRFAIAVGEGQFKNNQVFLGLVESTQLALERNVRGVGLQNFKYPPAFQEWCAMIHSLSPRTYRNMAQHFRVESERSIKHRASQRPRFPIGITPASFEHLATYLKTYGYPANHPLCLSVDDTKLLPAMHPLYDGPEKCWYLIGLPGEKQLKVTSPEELERLMDQNHSPATKLRLWAISIPFAGVPPLAFAILPISSTIKAPQLVVHHIAAMNGLVERNYRFISNVADGAAVERDCQARVAAKSKTIRHTIPPPSHFAEPTILVPLYDFRGNIFINTQDAPHARKTGRNNIFSGARGLVLGDFTVHYKQLLDLATAVDNPPLYDRDVIKADKQDDNAALRVFSAASLKKLTENVENLGLIVFLFVIGELVDAYESRSMTHALRAKAVLRARLFFSTWKLFLDKQGYLQARYYISSAADKIYDMLIDGLLGLILIHRDHLSSPTIPLLLWKHESMGNERIFAALRDLFPDMSLAQAVFAIPNLRATMSAAKQALFSKASFKKKANGYSFVEASEDHSVNLARLAIFPTDTELTALYGEAIEENTMLWSLLNVNTHALATAPAVNISPSPVDHADHPEAHLTEDDIVDMEASIVDLSIKDELDQALAAVQEVIGLQRAEEEEVDLCVYAAAALVVDNLSRIDDLPALEDPAQLEICRKDIARIIKMTPQTVESLLTGLKSSFGGPSQRHLDNPALMPPVISDITASELEPLVSIREMHQTEHAHKGVRSFKPGLHLKKKQPSEKQLVARRIQAVIRNANGRKATTGLNRKARTEQPELEDTVTKPAGNAANAAAATEVRASTASRRRKTLLKNLKCHSDISEAGIGPLTPLRANDYLFIIEKEDILLARVITIYSKGGGKGGKHEYVSSVDSIGRISYVFTQTFLHSAGRMFQRLHSASASLGISRFAHLPAGSIILRISDQVKLKGNMAEVMPATALKYKELQSEQRELVRMVTVLNTVQRRGKANTNVMDLEEEDDVDS
ncbi:hypothetical protein MVEN_00046000 [Mycena venus]|uniref:Ubiquitin-like protease family profile domain-containing protein n=1 Tax=Mycena venus TaxID=2733690 RepID=A0A8H6Z6Y4_9AGAR|nr:hypothetical protein MVEN_00046000 [Mycena venus]